ncbi:MAG: sigma-70 family RNA polymerase sigma factor [Planctomycetota bacterium]
MGAPQDDSTRPSLLIRIKDSSNAKAWQEFFDLYSPLIYSYARQRGLEHDDAEDIRSSVYETVVTKIVEFDYTDGKTGFRAWLRTVVHRRVVDFYRKKRPESAESSDLRNLEDPQRSADEIWDRNWRLHHLKHCVAEVGRRVNPASFQAFQLLTEKELSVAEVCEQLKMTPGQVHKIKSRFLELVRQEMQQFECDS